MPRRKVTNVTAKKGWKTIVCAAIAEGGTVTEAALAAGVARVTIYRHLESDEKFRKAFDDATEQGTDVIEAEATRRAVHGVEEPVIYQGQPTLIGFDANNNPCSPDADCCVRREMFTIRKPSDTLAIFLLKGRRPNKFRERYELTGKDGGPIETKDNREISAAEIDKALERYIGERVISRSAPQNGNGESVHTGSGR